MNEFQYLMLQDGYFFQKSSQNGEIYKEELPFSIFQDGEVADYHHFLYLIKKFLKERGWNEGIKVLLLVDSSQIQHINYRIPKVEEKDLEEFLRIELEDSYNIKCSDYEMVCDSFVSDAEIHLSIELIPKKISEPLRKVFDNIGSEIIGIFPKYFIYPPQGIYCNMGFTNMNLVKKSSDHTFQSEYIRNRELLQFYHSQNVESSNVVRLLTGRYDLMRGEVDEDFELMANNLFSFIFSKAASQLKGQSFVLTGPLFEYSMVQKLLGTGEREIVLEENLFKDYVYTKKNAKKYYPWKKFLPLFIIAILLGGNMWYYQHLKKEQVYWRSREEQRQELMKNTPKIENINSSDLHQTKNLEFLDCIKRIQQRENERIMFTDYSYQGDYFVVRGILREKDDIELLKDLPIQSQSITKDQGIYKFEVEIKNF